MKRLTFALLSVLALAACTGKPPTPQAEAPPRVATPLDDLKKKEQQARDVQKTIDQQAAEQKKQLDAAEQ